MSRNDYFDYGTTPPLNICSIQNFRYPPYSTTASKISACKKHFLHFCSVILCTAWHPRDNFWFLLPCHRKKKTHRFYRRCACHRHQCRTHANLELLIYLSYRQPGFREFRSNRLIFVRINPPWPPTACPVCQQSPPVPCQPSAWQFQC